MISNPDFLLFFPIITGTIQCWKYRFPTIFFPKSRNTVLKIFIFRPPANTTPHSILRNMLKKVKRQNTKKHNKVQASSKTRTRNLNLDLKIKELSKKRIPSKNQTSRPTTLLFFLFQIKDNYDAIHFHMKNRGVQDLVFVQIMFDTNFYFQNDKVST